jgi:23S rRNA pseudouridine2605 synthase
MPSRPSSPSSRPPKPPSNPQGERVQKLLAAAGFGSRREIERWIEAGRIRIGDRVAKLGDRAKPGDAFFLDGKPLETGKGKTQIRVLAYHKPVGEVVTRSDPEGRPTVFANLPPLEAGRWVNVGRLDLNSSGLLLFTNDGALANQLMHPRQEIEREYEVRVQGGLDEARRSALLKGVALEDGEARFKRLDEIRESEGTNRWYRVVLAEGRNREVRRMIEAVGARVSRLIRVRFGPIFLPKTLASGRHAELGAETVAKIVRDVKSC